MSSKPRRQTATPSESVGCHFTTAAVQALPWLTVSGAGRRGLNCGTGRMLTARTRKPRPTETRVPPAVLAWLTDTAVIARVGPTSRATTDIIIIIIMAAGARSTAERSNEVDAALLGSTRAAVPLTLVHVWINLHNTKYFHTGYNPYFTINGSSILYSSGDVFQSV